METFSPDHAFYRTGGQRKDPRVTIFLAESSTGCEQALVEFPVLVDGVSMEVRDLKFSTVMEQGDTFGRVIWRNYGGSYRAILGYDFYISGTDVIPFGGIRQILVNDVNLNHYAREFDLSPDTETLAFRYYVKDSVTGLHQYSIRAIDIDYCDVLPAGCLYDDARAVVLAETTPASDFDEGLADPTWGPLGRRIYFNYGEIGDHWALKFAEFEEGWESSVWPPSFITKSLWHSSTQPEYPRAYNLAGGVMGSQEYLAAVFHNPEKINCGFVYLINVQDCERVEDPICFTEMAFEGANPSWTRDGKIIHHYMDPKARSCSVFGGTVGIHDGVSVEALADGYFPDGAGGLPE
jgi:hypothetical protein